MMNYYYRSIPSEEMSDFEIFYQTIAVQLPPHAFIAELGVSDGRSVILMASLMKFLDKPCTIWAVDNFSYGLDDQRGTLARNILNSGEENIHTMDMESLVAATRCQDDQFDFVFIDSSHLYEMTKAEIRLWVHKIKTGGVLAGHDYADNSEVRQAVNELIPAHLLNIVETNNGHGVWWVLKTPDLKLLK